jgi:hypothetical protein
MQRTGPAVLVLLLWALASTLAAAPREPLPSTLTGKVVSFADADTVTVLVGKTQHGIRPCRAGIRCFAKGRTPLLGAAWNAHHVRGNAGEIFFPE